MEVSQPGTPPSATQTAQRITILTPIDLDTSFELECDWISRCKQKENDLEEYHLEAGLKAAIGAFGKFMIPESSLEPLRQLLDKAGISLGHNGQFGELIFFPVGVGVIVLYCEYQDKTKTLNGLRGRLMDDGKEVLIDDLLPRKIHQMALTTKDKARHALSVLKEIPHTRREPDQEAEWIYPILDVGPIEGNDVKKRNFFEADHNIDYDVCQVNAAAYKRGMTHKALVELFITRVVTFELMSILREMGDVFINKTARPDRSNSSVNQLRRFMVRLLNAYHPTIWTYDATSRRLLEAIDESWETSKEVAACREVIDLSTLINESDREEREKQFQNRLGVAGFIITVASLESVAIDLHDFYARYPDYRCAILALIFLSVLALVGLIFRLR